MFFKKRYKRNEKSLLEENTREESLQKILNTQEQLLCQIGQLRQETEEKENTGLSEILDAQHQLQKTVRRSMESIDDLIDTIQEKLPDQESESEPAGEKEKKLCELLGICMEQLWLLEENLSGNEQWKKQFSIMRRTRKQQEALAAVQETGHPGEQFHYRLHEIVQTEDTEDENKEGMIAKMYAPGLVYCGEVIKKAKVCVYRRKENEQDNRN